jgi:hypothetical protein
MALAALPAASFPQALGDGAALEAGYRFLGNPAVDAGAILEPHHRESAARCLARGGVIVAHDTTEFEFPGKRRGLGRIRGHVKHKGGFLAHVALAISSDASREPLGVLHLETWTRGGEAKLSAEKSRRRRRGAPDRESLRWLRGVDAVETRLEAGRAVHVMDREADAYDLIASLVAGQRRFIIRSAHDRRLDDESYLSDALATPKIVVTRDVPLSSRKRAEFPADRKLHPMRGPRTATLGIKAVTVTLRRPHGLPATVPRDVEVHVVVVEERNAPAGETPVVWRLYTTEPIATPADLERVVDAYRCRWVDEEFFKVLKTGCAIEKRQLESRHALVNALAVYIPIAWRVLRHRNLAQYAGDRAASTLMTKLQIQILRRVSEMRLPRALGIADALVAVAALGGHLQRNGPPGWITLARGYERLLTLEEGALLLKM